MKIKFKVTVLEQIANMLLRPSKKHNFDLKIHFTVEAHI